MNKGTSRIWKGTMIVLSTNRKHSRLPGKSNLANPYPARAEKITVTTTSVPAIRKLLKK